MSTTAITKTLTTTLITALKNPKAYPDKPHQVHMIETHLSWVFLTGHTAYKVKKPVSFYFADFSTLALRQHYCTIELALNRELNDEIYLSLVTINQASDGTIKINGDGEIIDYALQMREFKQNNLLCEVIKRNELTTNMIDDLAQTVADFHQRTPIALADSAHGTPDNVWYRVEKNFSEAYPFFTKPEDVALLKELEHIAIQEHARLTPVFEARKKDGYIRSCHGDLHLRNMVLLNNKPVIFDRIEFNELWRWVDVMADTAFMLIDLCHHQQPRLATRFLNRYLHVTGDYQGLAVLRYYMNYRALVRAKIHLYETKFEKNPEKIAHLYQVHHNYVQLAQSFNNPRKKQLFIMHGVSGSGKSTMAQIIAEHIGGIYIRADVERKRLFPHASRAALYQPETTETVYDHLLALSQGIIQNNYPVIVDATFLNPEHRQLFFNLAHQLDAQFGIIDCQANRETLTNHLLQRANTAENVSDATLDVLNEQLANDFSLGENELLYTLSLNTDALLEVHAIISGYRTKFETDGE